MIERVSGRIKRDLADLIEWDKSLPDYVFNMAGYDHAYIFDSPITGRPDLLNEIVEVLEATFGPTGFLSTGHASRTGAFDWESADQTTLVFGDASSAHRFAEHLRRAPYTGATCGSNDARDWLLFEDPSDGAGVLISKQRLMPEGYTFRNFFTLQELRSFAGPGGLDWDQSFVRDLAVNYAPGASAVDPRHCGDDEVTDDG